MKTINFLEKDEGNQIMQFDYSSHIKESRDTRIFFNILINLEGFTVKIKSKSFQSELELFVKYLKNMYEQQVYSMADFKPMESNIIIKFEQELGQIKAKVEISNTHSMHNPVLSFVYYLDQSYLPELIGGIENFIDL